MSFSLYSATVPVFLQMLDSLSALLDKAEAHCAEAGLDPQTLIGSRLAPDMLPFAYQVKASVVHSIIALDHARDGLATPDNSPLPDSFAALKAWVDGARTRLATIDRAEVDALKGREVIFSAGTMRLEFVAEEFLMSFSQPNFYFHVTTAYALLRASGVPIGKWDYLGRSRLAA